MYLEYNRVKSIVEYLEASNKSKKMPFKFSKNEDISNKLPKVKQKVESKLAYQKIMCSLSITQSL